MKILNRLTIVTGILIPLVLHASEGDTKAHVAQEQDIVDAASYDKQLVDLALEKGTPTLHEGIIFNSFVFRDGTTLYRDARNTTIYAYNRDRTPSGFYVFNGYSAHNLGDAFINYRRRNAYMLSYMAAHNDTHNVLRFFQTKRQFVPNDCNLIDAIKYTFQNKNLDMFVTIIRNVHHFLDDHGLKTILNQYQFNKKTNSDFLVDWAVIIIKQHPEQWQTIIGNSLALSWVHCSRFNHNFEYGKFLIERGAIANTDLFAQVVEEALAYPKKDNPYFDFIKFLLRYGADPTYAKTLTDGTRSKSAMDHLIIQGTNKECIIAVRQIITDFYKDAMSDTECGPVADIIIDSLIGNDQELMRITHEGTATKLKQKLTSGILAPECVNNNPKTALHYAAQQGDCQKVETLIDAGADIMKQEDHGMTPCMLAAEAGHVDVVRFLIEATPIEHVEDMVNVRSTYTSPPITKSRFRVRRLNKIPTQKKEPSNRYRVRSNPSGNSSHIPITNDVSGSTALILAVKQGHYDVAHTLLQAGADKTLFDNSGKSALDYAKEKKNEAMIKLLKS